MSKRPGDTGHEMPGQDRGAGGREDDLDRRRKDLDAAILARRPAAGEKDRADGSSGMAGIGNALKLSSEFIAGIVVGAAIGWIIDRLAGTSPFGLVVFLLLGFGAGVLNALRSAGLITQAGIRSSGKDEGGPGRK
ncbi:AtpZ/AtpI family protein [Aquibium oceanicum]|uniref:ATP synthase protein I n=1 Tax=Aquibium oceanicum TaxID=1670800 RepID=A0A1L3SP26_9HYPH|nr:hypothetical protein BSQ44_07050 [Aquibium oceanicum]